MPEADKKYTPIDCGFYDELEARATLRRLARFVYREGDAEKTIEDYIDDLFSEGDAEYVRLKGGTVIRLDHLVSVDGRPLPDAC